jgi:hypothetical protein
MKNSFLLTITLLLLIACKEAGDFYMGVPLQPRFERNSYTPGLNIFGILRPDSTSIFNNSFVEIEKVLPAVGKIDSFNVDTVLVTVEKLISDNEKTDYNFVLTNSNGTYTSTNYRPENVFTPQPGEIYSITCNHPDFPVLQAMTIIPNKAEVVPNSVKTENNFFSFEILQDTSFFMIDVYCYDSVLISYNRYASEAGKNTLIEMQVDGNSIDSALVFTYDFNMAKYYLTSNTSLNFNKYRNSFSTVKNGYGVFGSVNKNIIKFR